MVDINTVVDDDEIIDYPEDTDPATIAAMDAVYEAATSFSHPDLDGFDLDIESPPPEPLHVPRGVAKSEVAWEQYLEFLKPKPGTWVRLFTFSDPDTARNAAKSRARSVTKRLLKTQIAEVFEIRAGQDRDGEGRLLPEWKVWAQYVGPASPATMKERLDKAEEARQRGVHASAMAAQKRAQNS